MSKDSVVDRCNAFSLAAPEVVSTRQVALRDHSGPGRSRRGRAPLTAVCGLDLKAVARKMECDRYPEPETPRPLRVSVRVRTRVEGEEEALGSVWVGGRGAF